ncbi:unnamed protein product [Acanthoscelides obtectus]|uniref:Uncharacterized protein n=1 Tax=Acanthoscelides obtectus TaxID=200917 RepID=A0A9P0NX65_ACAOB|nr:unnamed protein product [Acanthoscelides obtectus]CAK1642232.1 hypothetical protein AOBTE_LOCUS12908 [Acanthoscelides obtectus]
MSPTKNPSLGSNSSETEKTATLSQPSTSRAIVNVICKQIIPPNRVVVTNNLLRSLCTSKKG